MSNNLLPLYGLIVTVLLCSAATPWLRRLYRQRFGEPEAGPAAAPPPESLPECGTDAGPFATTGQVCFAGLVMAAVTLLDRIPVATVPVGVSGKVVTLLELGLMPFLSANVLTHMVAILMPPLRRRAAAPGAVDWGSLMVYCLTVAIALYQSVLFSRLGDDVRPAGTAGTAVHVSIGVWLFIGAMLCVALTLLVNRVCGGHGFSLVLLALFVCGSGTRLAAIGGELRPEADLPGIRLGAFLLPLVPVVLFGLVAVGLLWERTLTLRRAPGDGCVRLAVPVAMTGNEPLSLAGCCLYPLLALPWLRQAAIAKHLSYGTPAHMALLGAFVALFVCLYALVLLPPRGFRTRLAAFGLAPVPAGSAPEPTSRASPSVVSGNGLEQWGGSAGASLSRTPPFKGRTGHHTRSLWAIQWPWLCILLLCAWLPQILMGFLSVPAALSSSLEHVAIILAALTAASLTQRAVRHRGWQRVFRHRELSEVLAVRAGLAARGIPSEVTWREAYGQLTGMFVGPLADKALYVPADCAVEAAGSIEEVQCGLTPEQPDRTPAAGAGAAAGT